MFVSSTPVPARFPHRIRFQGQGQQDPPAELTLPELPALESRERGFMKQFVNEAAAQGKNAKSSSFILPHHDKANQSVWFLTGDPADIPQLKEATKAQEGFAYDAATDTVTMVDGNKPCHFLTYQQMKTLTDQI